MAVMAEGVQCYADGGGKATAATRPLYRRDTVARFVQGLQRTGFKAGARVEMALINGRQRFIVRNAQGQATTVLYLEVEADLIQGLYFMRNPDKLRDI
jgi:RNA polymerase sigma-70 factor (ECF subfamily)